MRVFALRVVLAAAIAGVLLRALPWLHEHRTRVFGYSWPFELLVLTWLALLPIFLVSGRVTTSLSRLESRLPNVASQVEVLRVISPYGAGGCLAGLFFSGLLFWANFCGINFQPFPSPWIVAMGLALIVPLLLPPRHVGVTWTANDAIHVAWDDGSTFEVPLRSIDSTEQLLRENAFPFERFGRGTWRPLVLSDADERRFRQIVDDMRQRRVLRG